MSFFGPSAIHHSVSQNIGRALGEANALDSQVQRYIQLKQSVRHIAECALYSGYCVSSHSFLAGVVRGSDRRLDAAKGFAAQYPDVLQSARNRTAKYLAELSKPRLLRSGFRSSNTIMREKINPVLQKLAEQPSDFVAKVGHQGVSVSTVLRMQEDHKVFVRHIIKSAYKNGMPRYGQAGAGFGGRHERAAPQGGVPKREQPRTGASAQSSRIPLSRSRPQKDVYLKGLEALKSVWSSEKSRVGSLEALSELLVQAAQVNHLTVDALLTSCVNIKQAEQLRRPEANTTLTTKIHLALHPDKLEPMCLSLGKSREELEVLKGHASKFSSFLNWMKNA